MRIDIGHEHLQYGIPTGIHGELGAICLFKRDLGEEVISRLFFRG